MTLEDFTTYTETDEDGDITVTSNDITISTMRRDATSYVYKDYSGVYSWGAFEFDVEVTLTSADTTAVGGIVAVCDTNRTLLEMDAADTGISVFGYRNGGDSYYVIYLRCYDNSNNQDTMQIGNSPPYNYWLTFKRDASNNVTVEIYDDSDRTSLVDTLTATSGGDSYDTIACAISNGDVSNANSYTYEVDDLDLKEGIEHTFFPTDTLSISDSAANSLNINVSPTDNMSFTDTPYNSLNINVVANDTFNISDSVGYVLEIRVNPTDTLTITDNMNNSLTINLSPTDTLTITDGVVTVGCEDIDRDDSYHTLGMGIYVKPYQKGIKIKRRRIGI